MATVSLSAGLSGRDDLRDLVQAIPIASPGDIIAPDHHNMLREAVAKLAQSLDRTQTAPVVTASFAPILWPFWTDAPPWNAFMCFSVPSSASTSGWMPLDLPDGLDIDTMTVRGDRGGSTYTEWRFGLYRFELTGFQWGGAGWAQLGENLLDPAAQGAPTSFVDTVPLNTTGKTPTQVADLRRVDASKYRYAFYTGLQNASKPSQIQLQLVQVTCTRATA
jgi:hypothetical protein